MLAAAAMVVGAAMFGAPQTAQAVPISGEIIINGVVNNPTDTTAVDFVSGSVDLVSGDLATTISVNDVVALTDLDLSPGAVFPQTVWSVGGFSFSISAIIGIVTQIPDALNPKGIFFEAWGVLTGAGFEATTGIFSLSSNTTGSRASFSSVTAVPLPASLLLFSGGIAGLGMLAMRRRRKMGPATARLRS